MTDLRHDYSIIVAVDRRGLIGNGNQLPWRIPEDMEYFRKKTLGHTVIMGRRTWESIGRPLDQRTNVVLTNCKDYSPHGVIVCHDIAEIDGLPNQDECFVIGGAKVFELYLPMITRLYMTRIDGVFEGDTYFPDYDISEWELNYFEELETRSGIKLSFNEYQRKR